MKKILLLTVALLVFLLVLAGCSREGDPTLVYMVDGTVYHTSVLESEDDFFGNIGKEPEKNGCLFGGWYYDDGVWEKPLSYTDLNSAVKNKEYRVYAKWETVAFAFEESDRTYTVTGVLAGAGAEIVIPKTYKDVPVTAIAAGAFRGNTEITSVTLPDTVTAIGEYAFAECIALEKMVLPNAVKVVEKGAFSNCVSLSEVSFGIAVQEIKAESFAGCIRLTQITLPAAVKTVGARAFASSTNLSSVTLPAGILTVGGEAFSGCGVTELTFLGLMADWKGVAQTDFAKNSSLTSVKCLDGSFALTE